MTARPHDRLFALSGIAFVVLELGGAFLAMASGKTHSLTISSTAADIASALAKPVGTAVWAGAYMEIVSVAFFLVFAAWLAERLGGGLLGSIAKLLAAANAGAGVVGLALGDTLSYEAGRGMSLDIARTIVVANEAIYIASWFVVAGFLAAVGALALREGRRILGWSALAIVVYTLVTAPLSPDNAGQFSQMLWPIWVVFASIVLARSPRRAPVPAVAV